MQAAVIVAVASMFEAIVDDVEPKFSVVVEILQLALTVAVNDEPPAFANDPLVGQELEPDVARYSTVGEEAVHE